MSSCTGEAFFLSNYFTGTEAAAARAVGHTESAVPKRKTEPGSWFSFLFLKPQPDPAELSRTRSLHLYRTPETVSSHTALLGAQPKGAAQVSLWVSHSTLTSPRTGIS